MIALYKKELSIFYTTIVGQLIIGSFLLINSLLLWTKVNPSNILENSYASMDIFFEISPIILLIFIPALSMRTFAEEYNSGTIESILTKPISILQIISSKYLAILTLVILSIIPTSIYVLTIYFLGETIGNLDLAGIVGSYIGLICISSVFTSMSIFSSCLTKNQIIAFICGILISITFYFAFDITSSMLNGEIINAILKKIGILYHYDLMSKGLIKLSDVLYFFSLTIVFIKLSELVIHNKH